MRKWNLWLGTALFLSAGLSHATIMDRIVAVVNSDVITLSDLNTAFDPYLQKMERSQRSKPPESFIADAKRMMLDKLIDGALIAQEARKHKIEVNDQEVMAAIKDILQRRNSTMEALENALSDEGVSIGEYKKELREQIVKMRLIRREIKSKVIVTTEEVGEYYRAHRTEYEGKEAVRIKQIFLAFPGGMDERGRQRLRREAEQIRERLRKGESFDVLASQYSQNRGAEGGDLGFVEKGMVLPEVEQVAFDLEKGQVGPVIQSRAGFHLIMVTDRRGAGIKPMETVREEIRMKLEEEKLEKKFGEWMKELRLKSHIEVKL